MPGIAMTMRTRHSQPLPPVEETRMQDVPDKVWTLGFFFIIVFIIASYLQVGVLVHESGNPALQLLAKARLSLTPALLALVFILFGRVARGKAPLQIVSPQSWMMTGVFMLMVISAVFAADQVRFSLEYTSTRMFKLFMLFVLALACLESARSIRWMLWVLAGASQVLAYGALIKYVYDPYLYGDVPRAGYFGQYHDPNRLAGCLAVIIPAMVYLFSTTRSAFAKVALLLAAPPLLIAIMLTGSRGGLLALAVGLIAVLWFSRHRVIGVSLVAIIAVAGIVLMPMTLKTRYAEMKQLRGAATAQARLVIWGAGFKMATAHPFLGVGTGCYQHAAYHKYMPPDVLEGGRRWRPPHSSFVKILAENGVPAFLLFVLLHIVTFRDILRLRRQAAQRWGPKCLIAGQAAALFAILASTTVAALTIDYTDDIFPYLFIATVAALKHIGWRLGLRGAQPAGAAIPATPP